MQLSVFPIRSTCLAVGPFDLSTLTPPSSFLLVVLLLQEDLPTFLSLLRPGGRMVAIIEEEALLVTRSGQDPHDFSREVRNRSGVSNYTVTQLPTGVAGTSAACLSSCFVVRTDQMCIEYVCVCTLLGSPCHAPPRQAQSPVVPS